MATSPNTRHETNWAATYTYGYEKLLRPTTRAELCEVVAAEPHLRVLGSRHTFNGAPDAEVGLALDELEEELVVRPDRRSVVVDGGMTYAKLVRRLDREGLALHNLASLPHISVAGAIATATHGSGDGNGNLATAVCGLELVTADGTCVELTEADPELAGAAVHLGALGVVSRVALRVRPAFEVRQWVYEALPWDALLDGFDEVLGAAYSVSVVTGWGETAGRVWVKALADAPEPPETLCGARRATTPQHLIAGLDPEHCTQQLGVPGPWWDRLPHFRVGFTPSNGDELQSEFLLPREHAPAALRALRDQSAAWSGLAQATELRTIARDGLWMSPMHEQDTAAIHVTWVKDEPAVRSALADIEAALAPFGARPHWGKLAVGTHGVARTLDRLGDWLALRDRFDPEGKFTNAWLRDLLDEP